MSKAVLISIRQKWCQKIMAGRKTIEVRKTRPKMDTPFKCYIFHKNLLWRNQRIFQARGYRENLLSRPRRSREGFAGNGGQEGWQNVKT